MDTLTHIKSLFTYYCLYSFIFLKKCNWKNLNFFITEDDFCISYEAAHVAFSKKFNLNIIVFIVFILFII